MFRRKALAVAFGLVLALGSATAAAAKAGHGHHRSLGRVKNAGVGAAGRAGPSDATLKASYCTTLADANDQGDQGGNGQD